MPRKLMLRAAEDVFARSTAPSKVSMDEIASAAGVGKATLFRAFGSRDGLLDAVFAARLAPLQEEIERPGSTVGPDVSPRNRVGAVLELLLDFKLENSRLVAARELDAPGLLQSPHYRWVHSLVQDLIEQTGSSSDTARYTAHLLLGGLRADVITEQLASGCTREQILHELRTAASRLIT